MKTGGDGMISYLSSVLPTRPIASDYNSLHLSHLSLSPSFHLFPGFPLTVSQSILPPYLAFPTPLSCILSASL